jgi:Sec-independent protein translocase protein TatA
MLTGDYLLIGLTVILILLPSQVPAAGDAIGRLVDRIRGRTPEE